MWLAVGTHHYQQLMVITFRKHILVELSPEIDNLRKLWYVSRQF